MILILLEVVVAAHCGMKVLGISLITNKVVLPGDKHNEASHHEVLEAVQATQVYEINKNLFCYL